MSTEENRGCPRSRAFRDLGLRGRVNLGTSSDGGTEPPRFLAWEAGDPDLRREFSASCPLLDVRFRRFQRVALQAMQFSTLAIELVMNEAEVTVVLVLVPAIDSVGRKIGDLHKPR